MKYLRILIITGLIISLSGCISSEIRYNVIPQVISSSQYADLYIEIENTGDENSQFLLLITPHRDINVSIRDANANFNLTLIGQNYYIQTDVITPKQSRIYILRLTPSPRILLGQYPIPIESYYPSKEGWKRDKSVQAFIKISA